MPALAITTFHTRSTTTAGYGSWALISLLERVPHAGHRLVVEGGLLVLRGVARGEQHRVALAQRDVEVLGEGEDELGRRLRLAGLDEAEVAGRDADVEGEVHLAAPAVLPPVSQHRSDRRRGHRPATYGRRGCRRPDSTDGTAANVITPPGSPRARTR